MFDFFRRKAASTQLPPPPAAALTSVKLDMPPGLTSGASAIPDGLSSAGVIGNRTISGMSLYDASDFVRHLSHLVASTAAATPWVFERGGRTSTDASLTRFLRRPHPTVASFSKLIYGLALDMVVCGRAHAIGAPFDNIPRKSQVMRLRPQRVIVSQDTRPNFEEWPEYQVMLSQLVGRIFRPDPETGFCEILHASLPGVDLTTNLSGEARTAFGSSAAASHAAAHNWNRRLMRNSGRVGGILSLQDAVADEVKAASAAINAEITGQNLGRVIVLSAQAASFLEGSVTPKDADFAAASAQARSELAAAFGVPGQLVGVPDAQTYANVKEARHALYMLTVQPLLDAMADVLGPWLLQTLGIADGRGVEIKFRPDHEAAPAVADMAEDRLLRLAVGAAHIMTVNELRDRYGLQPLPDGDVVMVNSGMIPLSEAITPTPMTVDGPSPADAVDNNGDEAAT